MNRCLLGIFVVTLCCATSLVLAEQDFENVEIKAVAVHGPIYMLEGTGGNIGASVGEDGILIIDDQFAPLAEKIQKALKNLGEGKLKFVLNTHWHGDHTGGNVEFGKEATIIAHHNVRERLLSRQEVKMFNMVSEPKPKEALPLITFDDSLSVHFNGEEIKVLHLAQGHTDGDSAIIFTKSNVVHVGDHLFNGMYPFIDLDSGGNVEGYINNVADLIKIIPADAKIIPGHGPLASHGDYKAFYQMLKETTRLVKESIQEGKTLEDIQAKGFPQDIEENWGNGFLKTDKWISIIYRQFH